MTRARENLTLFQRADRHSRFPREVETTGVMVRAAPRLIPNAGDSWMHRHFEMLTLDGLDLSFAGRKPSTDPVHQHLADLHDGSALRLEQFNDHLFLRDQNDYAVAKLSKRGAEKWRPRIQQIEAIRVLAIIERKQSEGNTSFANQTRVERWDIPLCEVIYHKTPPNSEGLRSLGSAQEDSSEKGKSCEGGSAIHRDARRT